MNLIALKNWVVYFAFLICSGCSVAPIEEPTACDPVRPIWKSIEEREDGSLTLTPEQLEELLNYIEALEGCNYA